MSTKNTAFNVKHEAQEESISVKVVFVLLFIVVGVGAFLIYSFYSWHILVKTKTFPEVNVSAIKSFFFFN